MKARHQWGIGGVASILALTSGLVLGQGTAEDPCASLQAPEAITFSSSIGEVSFPHLFHVEDLELECQECHHEVLAKGLSIPHPEYLEDFWLDCTTCHQERDTPACAQSCSNCHHPSPVTIADETLSSKVVIHERCWECHGITTGAEASGACGSCHQVPTQNQEG